MLGSDPGASRFWRLLVGDRAEMFGVFSDYDLQVIFDWIRGLQSVSDGQPPGPTQDPARTRTFRAA